LAPPAGVEFRFIEEARTKHRWAVRWKPALNAFAVTFTDRIHILN
jgi:hypothetical protein